ncbi:TetR/AcrR family transcriptional regulator [Cellulomonas sp. PhB143]|uniref:TetR/AcrR family transcriptional regulator n=1 Tax=Cellulomonas sp. PhB143 TaxID=2485186 RepID=UPI000F4A628C|nr:TetR/AcrR family transcriptional regulator [Cellulomonas sp. PhB143]ROS76489.1 TetR family transcriptional regulator [Cellulomonas sp. PhB143]
MAEERRTRLTPDERRAQLVSLGVAALADRPLESLTIEDLAARAGVSRGLLFYYFDSKQGFHREVVRAARDGLLHATEPSLQVPPLERLRTTLVNLVRFVREHEATFFSLVRGAASGDAAVREVTEQARELQAARLAAVCDELGVQASPRLTLALRAWVAFAEQLLVDGAIGTDMPADEIVELLEQSALGAIALVDPARSPAAPPGRPSFR